MTQRIFVFGSNLAGRHGAGSALHAARYWGAITGQGFGRQGDSFAIPTKDHKLRVLPLDIIGAHIDGFMDYARNRPDLTFQVVKIGCGLAGYKPEQIAPLFKAAIGLDNVVLPTDFIKHLQQG